MEIEKVSNSRLALSAESGGDAAGLYMKRGRFVRAPSWNCGV